METETDKSHEIEFYDMDEEDGRSPSFDNPIFNRTEEFVYLMSEKRGTKRRITIYKTPEFTLHQKISIRGDQVQSAPLWLGDYTLLTVQSTLNVYSVMTGKKVTLGKKIEGRYDETAIVSDPLSGKKLLISFDGDSKMLKKQVIRGHTPVDGSDGEIEEFYNTKTLTPKTFVLEGKPTQSTEQLEYEHAYPTLFTHIPNRVFASVADKVVEYDLKLTKLREVSLLTLLGVSSLWCPKIREASDGLLAISYDAKAYIWDPVSGMFMVTYTEGEKCYGCGESDAWTFSWKKGGRPVFVLTDDTASMVIKRF